jgi:hypothetical protein
MTTAVMEQEQGYLTASDPETAVEIPPNLGEAIENADRSFRDWQGRLDRAAADPKTQLADEDVLPPPAVHTAFDGVVFAAARSVDAEGRGPTGLGELFALIAKFAELWRSYLTRETNRHEPVREKLPVDNSTLETFSKVAETAARLAKPIPACNHESIAELARQNVPAHQVGRMFGITTSEAIGYMAGVPIPADVQNPADVEFARRRAERFAPFDADAVVEQSAMLKIARRRINAGEL